MKIRLRPGITLKAHQLHDLKFFLSRRKAGNFSEMGAGKTLPTALAALGLLQDGHVDSVVALMPDSIFDEWGKTLSQLIETPVRPYYFHGVGRNRELALAHPWVITTYQTFMNEYIVTKGKDGKTPRGVYLDKSSLFYKKSQAQRVCLIVDEASCLRRVEAKRTKAITNFASQGALFTYLLTGNPMPNGAINMYSLLRILDPEAYPTLRYFMHQHCVMQGDPDTGDPVIVAYKNLKPLQDHVDRVSVRHLKAECLDLPAKTFVTRHLEMPKWHLDLYNKALEQAFLELPSGEVLSFKNVFSMIIRSRQLATDPALIGLDPSTHKEKQLRRDLEDIGHHDGHKVVVFSEFVQSGYRIMKIARELGWNPAQVFDTQRIDKKVEIKRFQDDPSCNLIVVNPAAGGLGVNLSAANWNIFYEYSYNLDHHDQALERSHRMGLIGPLTVLYYITDGTVEPGILKALQGKKLLSADVLRDPKHLLNFLLFKEVPLVDPDQSLGLDFEI